MAYAVGIEQERLIVMELLKEVTLYPKSKKEWPQFFDKSCLSQTKIRKMDCAPFGENGMLLLVQVFSSPGMEITDAVNSVVKDQNVRAAYFSGMGSNTAVGLIITGNSPACRAVKSQMAFCNNCLLNAQRNESGEVEWHIILEEATLEPLLAKLKSVGISIGIKSLRDLHGNSHLTSKQYQVLKLALEKGYFEFPKRNNMKELADTFGISIPALSETLRRAEKKLVKEHYSR